MLLPEWSDGYHALCALAYRAEFAHDLSSTSLTDRLAALDSMSSYTPDERAAFALAREALAAGIEGGAP